MLPTPPEGLRHWRPDDAPALEAAWSDPDIVRWNPPPDLDARTWIAGAEERWDRRAALDLVVVPPDEAADPVAGEVGLSGFSTRPARAELGVWVAASHRRRGVARRAVRAVTAWALSDPSEAATSGGLGLDQVWARNDLANAAAEALFADLGWDRLGSVRGRSIWSATAAVLR